MGDEVKRYTELEVQNCLRELKNRGVVIDELPGDMTIQNLFEMLESFRPN